MGRLSRLPLAKRLRGQYLVKCIQGKSISPLPMSAKHSVDLVFSSRLQKEDAEKITIPHIVLASNGEDATVVQEYKDILEAGNGVVETYPTMHRKHNQFFDFTLPDPNDACFIFCILFSS